MKQRVHPGNGEEPSGLQNLFEPVNDLAAKPVFPGRCACPELIEGRPTGKKRLVVRFDLRSHDRMLAESVQTLSSAKGKGSRRSSEAGLVLMV